MYSNSEVRPLTLGDSATNKAHEIWYCHLTPLQRCEVMGCVELSLSQGNKLNACLNYIEDNQEYFLCQKPPSYE